MVRRSRARRLPLHQCNVFAGVVRLDDGRVGGADIGRPVHDLVPHPAFGDAVVGEIFDADNGHFWVPASLHVFNADGAVLT